VRNCPTCGASYADDLAFCPNDGTATVVRSGAPPSDALVGSIIDGRYRVEARIGEGGMGVVYRASHVVLKKALAIKVMRSEQAHDGEVVQRFVQEARSSSAIGHPNIIGISDFGTTQDGSVYFAMEYLEGQTLGKAMEDGGIERERAIALFLQITSALEAAHQNGIVHRDLKPDNIFLAKLGGQTDVVKILDFGIAKVKNAAAKITRTGMVFGTPHYMSPEQAAGQAVDQRSDIYSLGVIMFQVFAGQLPFDAESYMGVMTKHMFDPPPRPSSVKPGLRGSIEDVILMALAKKPEERYQSMLAIKEDFERLRRGERVSASDLPIVSGMGDTLPLATLSGQAVIEAGAGRPSAAGARDTALSVEIPIRRRPPWIVPAIGVGVAALIAIASISGREGARDAAAPAVRPPSAAPVAAPAPTAPSPTADPPLSQQQLHVVVTPASAQIEVDGVVVGQGDVQVVRPTVGQSQRMAVRAAGYVTQSVSLDAQTPNLLRVELVREPAKAATPAGSKPRAKPAAAPTPAPAPVEATPTPAPGGKRRSGLNDVVDPWQ
jgi:eukaryotic-like serine/threonine-protein kinase